MGVGVRVGGGVGKEGGRMRERPAEKGKLEGMKRRGR